MSRERKLKCPECAFTSAHSRSLRTHRKREHPATYVPWESVINSQLVGKMPKKNWWKYRCDACDYKTLSENLYAIHMRSKEHKAFADIMLKHGQSAPERKHLIRSTIKSDHDEATEQVATKSEPALRDEDHKEFTCDKCPYSTTWETEYMWHRESHYKKPKVDLAASSEESIKFEVSDQVNSDVRPSTQAKLDSLIKGEAEGSQDTLGDLGAASKKYKCSKCERSLSTKDSLKTHMAYVHTDIREFKCDFCEYAAKRPDTLHRHIRRVHHKEPKSRGDLHHGKATNAVKVQEESGPRIEGSYSIKSEHVDCGEKPEINSETGVGNSAMDTGGEQLISLPTATKSFSCWECSYKTKCKSSLKEHMLVHKGTNHLQFERENQEQDIGDLEYELQGRTIPNTHANTDYGATSFNMDTMESTTEDNNKTQQASNKTKLTNNFLPKFQNILPKKAVDLLNTFKCQHCPYSTKWKKELNRHVRVRHINEDNTDISLQTDSIDPFASPEVVPVTQRGTVGKGDLHFKILLGQTHSFGPINVRSAWEAQLLKALVQEKCDAVSHRGKTVHAAPQYYSLAERAKSVLHPEVVKHINYVFTVKGLREHQPGRRSNNYPKRSQIIKVGRNGEYIYPSGPPSDAIPNEIVKNHDVSTVPILVQSTWKRQGNDKVDIFLCQHCNYRTVNKSNFIAHNQALHGVIGVIVDDRSFEEKGMKAPAETVSVSEAQSHKEHSETEDEDDPPLPQDQIEIKDERAWEDPLLPQKAPENPSSAFLPPKGSPEKSLSALLPPKAPEKPLSALPPPPSEFLEKRLSDSLLPPKAPEKPLSAYMRFSKKCWASLRKQHPDLKMWEIGNIIGGKWRDLKAEEKKEYQDAWSLDKVRLFTYINRYPTECFGSIPRDLFSPSK